MERELNSVADTKIFDKKILKTTYGMTSLENKKKKKKQSSHILSH